jgi:glycine/D-amino acid oxidase-like deaminating enzyme
LSRYTAKRLPRHLGQAAWGAILPPQDAPDVLNEGTTADFAVIGGGFAGLSAARRLMQLNPGARVIVLEAGRLAEGAAGRNSGFMIDLPHDLSSSDYAGSGSDRQVIDLNRTAISFARAAAEDYGIPEAFFDPAGKVNGAASAAGDAHNRSYAAHLAELGEASEMLDAQAMRELTGSSYYRSGLYTPGTVMLQPAGYIRSLGAGLKRDGVRICENTPVTGFQRAGDDWRIATEGGDVTAPKVILASNGHLESFGFARGRLMHIFLFASMTPDLDADSLKKLGGASRWGVTPSDPMGTTMRRIDTAQGGNRIITRTCARFEPGMEAAAADMARAARVQQQKFDDRFPALKGQKMELTWAGHLCLSRNGVSVMREVDDGIYAACVQNGLGTARGTLTGMGAAELASGAESAVTRTLQAEAEPDRLPPQPFAKWGANTYLRWKEWRAGGE